MFVLWDVGSRVRPSGMGVTGTHCERAPAGRPFCIGAAPALLGLYQQLSCCYVARAVVVAVRGVRFVGWTGAGVGCAPEPVARRGRSRAVLDVFARALGVPCACFFTACSVTKRLVREATERLVANTHPDPYIQPYMPGGSKFMRNPPPPFEVGLRTLCGTGCWACATQPLVSVMSGHHGARGVVCSCPWLLVWCAPPSSSPCPPSPPAAVFP